MRSHLSVSAGVLTLTNILSTEALNLDINSVQSIVNASTSIAHDLLGQYHGTPLGQNVGIFEGDNAWGESGAAWPSLIDYWNRTGDTGNDDQAFWALAAITAAEQQFPSPPSSPSWLHLAQNVFDLQAARWDTSSCGGGLHWQTFTFNRGYDYKNAISAGTFFQLAARLAQYTGNQTYADWAEKSYEWTSSVGLIDSDFKVYDAASIDQNCTQPMRLQWTYNAATFLYGSAVMYNFTKGSAQWQNRTQSLLTAISVFTSVSSNRHGTPGILVEIACEQYNTCNHEQHAFKGLAAQWMGATLKVAPFTANTITPTLQASALGAAASCLGGSNGTACGSQWTTGKSDGNTGFEQQLSALNVILANLAANASAPVTSNTTKVGTTSTGASGTPAPEASSGSFRLSSLQAAGSALNIICISALLL